MTYTVSLNFRRAWLLDVLNPLTNPIVCGTVRQSPRTDVQDGNIRQYSGGRRQGYTSDTGLVTIPVTLVGLNYAQWLIVRRWISLGTIVLFRSVQGEREYVTLFEADTSTALRTSMNDGRMFSVAVSLYPVDYDESV